MSEDKGGFNVQKPLAVSKSGLAYYGMISGGIITITRHPLVANSGYAETFGNFDTEEEAMAAIREALDAEN